MWVASIDRFSPVYRSPLHASCGNEGDPVITEFTVLRHVEPTKTTDGYVLKPLTKNAERREKFKKIGAAISKYRPGADYDGRDYHTGKALKFQFANVDEGHRDGFRIEVPHGPEFKTPQWKSTS